MVPVNNAKCTFIYFTFLWFYSHSEKVSTFLQRNIAKSGFHRDVVTQLTVPTELLPDVRVDGNIECFLLFTESVPSGAYIDSDQINLLKNYGGPDVLLNTFVDVEKAEFESTEFTGHIFTNLSHVGDNWTSTYTLPIHLRYHSISDQDYTTVTFNNPEVAIRCHNNEIGMPHHSYHGNTTRQKSEVCSSNSKVLCDWIVLQYDTENAELTIEVPVGKMEHYLLVTLGTMATTLIGCGFLVYHTLHTDIKER